MTTVTVNVNVKMDKKVKDQLQEVCNEMGMSMSTAFLIFAKKVCNERRIPFEVSADPFYSEANIRHLENVKRRFEDGTAKYAEHDLLEVE